MISEFKNQLSQKEILKGLFIYINRKLWHVLLLLMIIAGVFAYLGNNNFSYGLLGAFAVAMGAEILLMLILMQQFSTEKIATYKMNNDFLEIISSNNVSQNYKYSQIQSIEAKDIIVLLLTNTSFAIVAKRHMNTEQIHILQSRR